MSTSFWHDSINTDAGPYKPLLKRGTFTDSTRENDDGSVRVVEFKLYHPVHDTLRKPLPTIIWSHGFGGNKDGAAFLSRYLTTYGYNILHITHHGTDSSLWEGKPGHPWNHLRKATVSRHTSLNRFYDIPFAVNEIQKWAQKNPEIGALMDLEMLGMSGHSYGALTTQIMAGQLTPDKNNTLISLAEPRFKAGILYSVVPVKHLMSEPETITAYNAITLPLFHMTGTQDDSPIEGFGYKERLAVYNNTINAPKSLLIKQDGDHMIYNGTRGKLGNNPLRERHEDIIKITSLAYWNAMLKNSSIAKEWLEGEASQRYIANNGTICFE